MILKPSQEDGLRVPATGTLATRFSSRAFGSRTAVMFQGRQVLLRVSLLAVAGVFTLLALSPTPVGLANDKLDHFAAFLVLGLLARLTFPSQGAVLTGLCLSLFGAGLEVLQGLPFIQRDSDIGDWAADLAGIALATLITWTFSRSKRRPAPQ